MAPASIQTHAPFEDGNPSRPSDARPGRRASYRTLSREERLEVIREAQWQDAFDPELTPRDRQAARIDLQNRMEGLPVQKIVTPDAKDMWFIEGVAEAVSSEAWESQARLLTAKPHGNAD